MISPVPEENNQEIEAQSTIVLPTTKPIGTEPTDAEIAAEEDLLFYILCGGAAILLIAIIFICYKCRNKGKIRQGQGAEPDLYPANHTGDNQSMQLDSISEQ